MATSAMEELMTGNHLFGDADHRASAPLDSVERSL